VAAEDEQREDSGGAAEPSEALDTTRLGAPDADEPDGLRGSGVNITSPDLGRTAPPGGDVGGAAGENDGSAQSGSGRAPDRPAPPAPETLGMAQTMESDDGRGAGRTPRAEKTTIPPGTMLDDVYRVEDCIGRGAMGAVYTVEHLALGKRFAAKVLTETRTTDEDAVRRLQQEARAASAIDHENIVDVTHLGQTNDGTFFVVMELLRGEDLGARIERQRLAGGGPLPDVESRDVIGRLLSGLAAAHEAGIVHRDLKPENVFLARRSGRVRPKIVDFGISKLSTEQKVRLTQTGQLLGTPLYMAPEQTRGDSREIDGRADLYSLGIIAYEMVVGRHPFPSDNLYDILMKHANEAPPPPRTLRADLPEAVEAVVLRAMAKQPEDRFQTAREMLDAWQGAWNGLLPATPLLPPSEDSADWSNPSIPASPPRPKAEATTGSGGPAGIRWGWVAAPLALAVLAVAGVVWLGGPGASPETQAGEPVEAGEAAIDGPATTPGSSSGSASGPTGAEPNAGEATAADTPELPPGATPPAPHEVTLVSSPSGATVREGDETLGKTPLVVEIDPGDERTLTLDKAGRVEQTVTIDDTTDELFEVSLPRKPRDQPRLPSLAPR